MYRFAYRNFGSYQSWVVSQSVATGNGYTGIRWYQLRDTGSGPAMYQQGTFAPDSNYRWMPSIAQDKAGDIVLGYSVSSSTMHHAISFTGRVPSDPLGTMEAENSIVQGGGSQSYPGGLSRWGDYSDMSVDPTNDCTFWYTTEYLQSNGEFNWSARIASFSFPGCGTAPNFSLSASPTCQTVAQGSSTSYTNGVTPTNSYSGNVTLSVSSPSMLPAGITASFSPNPVGVGTSAGSSTLTVGTTSSTPAGSYTLTVSGTDGTLTNTTQLPVDVQAPAPPDFSLSSSPGSATVTQGSTANYTIAVSPSGGFSGTATINATSVPGGATATFTPSSLSIRSSPESSVLAIATTSSTSPGTYTVNVTGTSDSLSHTIQVTLIVQQPTSSDFTVTASPTSASAMPGSSATFTVNVAGSNPPYPFNGTVNLSVTGVPGHTTASFSTTSITGQGSATLTLSPRHSATDGTYILTSAGTSGSTWHAATVTFIIGTAATPDFSISASPTSATVNQGSSTSYAITVTPIGGFTGTVNLDVSSPSGVSASLPGSVDITSSSAVSTTLAVSTTTSTTPNTYTLTVTASGGGSTHSTSVTLVVQSSSGGGGNFTLSVSNASLTVGTKSSTSTSVTLAPSGGFTGTVSLGLSGLPKRTSYSFNPSTVTGSGSSSLTISTTPHTATGTYNLTITGTSGSITQTVPITLKVN